LEPVEVYASIYSPRWGHEDRYTFNFSMDRLDISHMARKTAAIWSDTSDPTWEGEKLAATMTNDSVYPPHNLESLIEFLWREWRDGRFSKEELQAELTAFAEFINAATKAKPQTDFWRGVF